MAFTFWLSLQKQSSHGSDLNQHCFAFKIVKCFIVLLFSRCKNEVRRAICEVKIMSNIFSSMEILQRKVKVQYEKRVLSDLNLLGSF